jgi:hypothetical protein
MHNHSRSPWQPQRLWLLLCCLCCCRCRQARQALVGAGVSAATGRVGDVGHHCIQQREIRHTSCDGARLDHT